MFPTIDDALLRSQGFKDALTNIKKRAERQLIDEKLEEVFVPTDLFTRLKTHDNQLILGRRGTGKTHMIKVFKHNQELAGNTTIYIDCTGIGSGLANHKGLSPFQVACKYFNVILNQIAADMADLILKMENPPPDLQAELERRLDDMTPFFEPEKQDEMPTFNYRQLADSFSNLLTGLGIDRLFIVIDEWANVPIEAQPFLAEYFKRTFFPIPAVSIKILAVNYQCKFYLEKNNDKIGFQLTADITDIIDIDGYFVFDEDSALVISYFSKLLYNHIGAELGWNLAISETDKAEVVSKLFTQANAFNELVRASEGNSRDFLCIFSQAYFSEFLHSTGNIKIGIKNIEEAAAFWFEKGKLQNINTEKEAQRALSYILDNVLKDYKSRTFMVEFSNAKDPTLLRLLNERIIHRLNKIYSHPDRPGIRYNLYSLDYGSYVKFKG